MRNVQKSIYAFLSRFTFIAWLYQCLRLLSFRRYSVLFSFLLLLFSHLCEAAPIKIQVFGMNAEDKKQILSGLSIAQASEEKHISETRVMSLHERAPREIEAILASLGYYQPEISSHISFYKKKWQAIYHIKPGQPIVIREVKIDIQGTGRNAPELREFKKHSPFTIGNRLTHSQYEEVKNRLLRTALQIGYLDALFKASEIRIHRTQHYADIILILETGPQYYFGAITFTQSKYPETFLQQYITFKPGDPYRTEPLSELQKTLTESDLFSKVRIDPELHHHQKHQVPLTVHLTDRPQNRYTFGIGFDTDLGGRGKIGVERKLLHHPGHRIQLNAQTTGVPGKALKSYASEQKAQLEYIIPGKHPSTDRLSFGMLGRKEKLRDKRQTREVDFSITDTKKINALERQWSLHYLSTIFTDGDTPKKHTTFLMPTINYEWTHAKRKDPPLLGHRIGIALKGGLRSLFSSTDLLQAEIKWKWIYPLTSSIRLLVRTNIGTVIADKKNEVPPTLRFYAGGDTTVRGFAYKSLGPTQLDRSGKVIVVGGRHLLTGSVELDKEIYRSFRGALFVDAGNAMNKWNERLVTSAGVGVRYSSPLGEFRLDIAKPVTRAYRKKRARIHLTFGTDL